MTLEQARDSLAEALWKAIKEHGIPNKFKASELHFKYNAPDSRLSGRIGKRFMVSLWRAMGGHEKLPTCPIYDRGWFLL